MLFAVNLEVPPDQLLNKTPGILMKRSMLNKPMKKEEEPPVKKPEDQKDQKKEKRSVFSEGADEIDTSRMKVIVTSHKFRVPTESLITLN